MSEMSRNYCRNIYVLSLILLHGRAAVGKSTSPPPPSLSPPPPPGGCDPLLGPTFQCAQGQCIKLQFRCDRQPQCADYSDEMNCTFYNENFLLLSGVTNGYHVYELELGDGQGETRQLPFIEYSLTANPLVGVAYDNIAAYVYWADNKARVINRFSTIDRTTAAVFTDTTGNATFGWLALDVGRQVLYYTDSGNGWIGVIDLNTGNQSTIYSDPASKPYAIVVDTVYSTLYWTDAVGPVLYTGSTSGNSSKSILSGILQPNAFAIDFSECVLYWASSTQQTVSTYNMVTGQVNLLRNDAGSKPDYRGMTIDTNNTYLNDGGNGGVVRAVNRFTGDTSNVQSVRVIGDAYQLEYVGPMPPHASGPCILAQTTVNILTTTIIATTSSIGTTAAAAATTNVILTTQGQASSKGQTTVATVTPLPTSPPGLDVGILTIWTIGAFVIASDCVLTVAALYCWRIGGIQGWRRSQMQSLERVEKRRYRVWYP